MATAPTRIHWLVWLLASFGAAAALGYTLFQGSDKKSYNILQLIDENIVLY